jgi:hypothetical protein
MSAMVLYLLFPSVSFVVVLVLSFPPFSPLFPGRDEAWIAVMMSAPPRRLAVTGWWDVGRRENARAHPAYGGHGDIMTAQAQTMAIVIALTRDDGRMRRMRRRRDDEDAFIFVVVPSVPTVVVARIAPASDLVGFISRDGWMRSAAIEFRTTERMRSDKDGTLHAHYWGEEEMKEQKYLCGRHGAYLPTYTYECRLHTLMDGMSK